MLGLMHNHGDDIGKRKHGPRSLPLPPSIPDASPCGTEAALIDPGVAGIAPSSVAPDRRHRGAGGPRRPQGLHPAVKPTWKEVRQACELRESIT